MVDVQERIAALEIEVSELRERLERYDRVVIALIGVAECALSPRTAGRC